MGKTWKDSGFRRHDHCREHPDRRKLREVKRHGDGGGRKENARHR